MLLLPVVRVVVSIPEDKSPVRLVTSSPRINLPDNAVRSRNDVELTALDDLSSFEAEKFVGTVEVASRPEADGLGRTLFLSVGDGGIVVCDAVNAKRARQCFVQSSCQRSTSSLGE